MEEIEYEPVCKLLGCVVKHKRNYKRHLSSHTFKKKVTRKKKKISGTYKCLAHEVPMEFKNLKEFKVHQYLFHRH